MGPTKIDERLDASRERGWQRLYPDDEIRITVGLGTCGIAAGAQDVFQELSRLTAESTVPCTLYPTGCLGACFAEPLVSVKIPGLPRVQYQAVDVAFCGRLVDALEAGVLPEEHVLGIQQRDWSELYGTWIDLCEASACPDYPQLEEHPFFLHQQKRLTASWGVVEPWSVDEYVALGGYRAFRRCLDALSAEDIVSLVEASGLRGRGGAGFPTGRKMRAVFQAPERQRYLVVNADEGDPGAYMDRGLMESDPHRLIEGIAIASYALGISKAVVFTRAEYPGAIYVLERALAEARKLGVIGEHAFGSQAGLDIQVVCSAGAYVCGEEQALLAALEGRRPDPGKKPPYPAECGYQGKPTFVCNVETFANLPSIVSRGSEKFRRYGTEQSPGTKIYSLAGAIKHAGLVEVPLGFPVADMVEFIAQPICVDERNVVRPGAMRSTAIQIGGPSGALFPAALPNLTLDFEGLTAAGGIMGSGGIVILGGQACIVDTVRYFVAFSAKSSCGQCRNCASGLSEAQYILERICAGFGSASDIAELERLVSRIPKGSKCALGKMAVNPLATALMYYREEFEQHVAGECPALVCKQLMHFSVVESACPGCMCCLPSCPAGAIKGVFGKAFRIDQTKCTKCWMCVSQCPYPALMALPGPAPDASSQQMPDSPVVAQLAGCVLCGRCVNACAQQGGHALCFAGSGIQRRVEKPSVAGVSFCLDCGACLEACPTGAIKAVHDQSSLD